jgi:hypothetical protein
MKLRSFAALVRKHLSNDLLKPPYQSWHTVGQWSWHSKVAGHCYIASEAAFHLLGGKQAGWTPMNIKHEGVSHWFLKHTSGKILDITAKQFSSPVPYQNARGRGS